MILLFEIKRAIRSFFAPGAIGGIIVHQVTREAESSIDRLSNDDTRRGSLWFV